MNKQSISKLFYLFLLVSLTSYSEDIYRWVDPKTGHLTNSPRLPDYPIKGKKEVGLLPNGKLIELIIDTDHPSIKNTIQNPKTTPVYNFNNPAVVNSDSNSISLTPSQLGVKSNIMRIISRYEDVGEIAMECKDQYRAYLPRNEMVRQCIRESRKSLEDLKKSIALIDKLLSKGEWAYEGESISSNDMMDKVLTICAKDTISDVYHNFSAMETCLKMAYQRLYSQLNYQ